MVRLKQKNGFLKMYRVCLMFNYGYFMLFLCVLSTHLNFNDLFRLYLLMISLHWTGS